MSTAAVQHPPSYSSPLRPRGESDENKEPTSHPSSKHQRGPSNGARPSSMSPSAATAAATRGNGAHTRSPSGELRSRPHRTPPHPDNNGTARSRQSPHANGSNSDSSQHGKAPPAVTSSPRVPSIKKERGSSPDGAGTQDAPPASARRRPRNLDLSSNKQGTAPGRPSAALGSAKETGALSAMQDVGLACLSPGFQTQDPGMQHQLARSMEMRDRQRQIIEARLHGRTVQEQASNAPEVPPNTAVSKEPATSKRRGPPPGLSIHAPSSQHFASKPLAIQSAPLGQSFTGLKPSASHIHPLARQVLDRQPSGGAPAGAGGPQNQSQGQSQGKSAGPPTAQGQPSNRLPPITDVFANEGLGSARHAPNNYTYSPHTSQGPLPSPRFAAPASAGLAPPRSNPHASAKDDSRPRDYRSAEEAVAALSGGREDLQPRLVHYSGSRRTPSPQRDRDREREYDRERAYAPVGDSLREYRARAGEGSARRRTRDEYEADVTDADRDVDEVERGRARARRAGLGVSAVDEEWERRRGAGANASAHAAAAAQQFYAGASAARYGARERESPETYARKREEFMMLCARLWDLIHS